VLRQLRNKDHLLNGAMPNTCPALKRLTRVLVRQKKAWVRTSNNKINKEFLQRISTQAGYQVKMDASLLKVFDHIKGMVRHGHLALLPENLRSKHAIRNIEKLVTFMHRRGYRPRKISKLVAGPLLGAVLEQMKRALWETCASQTQLPRTHAGDITCQTPLEEVQQAVGAARASTTPVLQPRLIMHVGDDPSLTALLSLMDLLGKEDIGWWPGSEWHRDHRHATSRPVCRLFPCLDLRGNEDCLPSPP
jgi:hypothetical protein